MRIEMKGGGLRLGRGQILKVLDGAGSTVCADDGAVWITEENEPNDVVLQRGGCHRLRHRGTAIVYAIGGEANLRLV